MSTETEKASAKRTEEEDVAVDPVEDTETAEAENTSDEEAGLEGTERVSDVDTPKRRSRVLTTFVAIGLVALVAGGVLGGMAWRQQSVSSARQDALSAGNKAAVELLSYDYRTVAQSVDARMNQLTGDFREHYRSMVQDQISPVALEKQIGTTASVVASSVVDGDADRVTLLLFINQSSTAPSLKEPLVTGSRINMTLENSDGNWLISELKPV